MARKKERVMFTNNSIPTAYRPIMEKLGIFKRCCVDGVHSSIFDIMTEDTLHVRCKINISSSLGKDVVIDTDYAAPEYNFVTSYFEDSPYTIPHTKFISRATGNCMAIYINSSNSLVVSSSNVRLAEIIAPYVNITGLNYLAIPDKIENLKVTLGCDPEFELIKDGSIVSAHSYISLERLAEGVIGKDGEGRQVELRPLPSEKEEEVVERVGQLMKYLYSIGFELSVSGNSYPLGGHIHIGGVPHHPAFIKLLDDFLGKKVLKLSGRARGSYRKLGAWERKPYGFEYRTPPSIVFVHPEITRIVFKIVKNLAYRFYGGEVIEYMYPPKEKEYVEVVGLSPVEASAFISFCKNANGVKSNLIKTEWGLRPTKTDINIVFRDEWSPYIAKSISLTLKQKLAGYAGTIVLFGLAESRGQVSTIEGTGYECIGLSEFGVDNNYIGLPYYFRNSQSEYSSKKDMVVDAIVRYVVDNGIVSKINQEKEEV